MNSGRVYNRDTVAVTDLGRYARNLRAIRDFTGPGVRLMAVVKADAYGHGLVECATTALGAGASMLGVAFLLEGEILREAGITAPILVMSSETPDHWEGLIRAKLTVTLTSAAMLEFLEDLLEAMNATCTAHVKVDTGMGRVGVGADDAVELVRRASASPRLTLEGIYSHFSSADEDRDDYSRGQLRLFMSILDELEGLGLRPSLAHMCNSAGLVRFPEAHLDMVRPGIMTYGLPAYPGSAEVTLEPVISLTSRIAFVKDVPAGTPVSYGGTFVTTRPSRLATVPVGYGDCFRRDFSGKARGIVRGVSVPAVGRVCMDQTVFDVTGAGDVRVGETITLIGRDGGEEVTVVEYAGIAGTITNEIVCGITGRTARAFIAAS